MTKEPSKESFYEKNKYTIGISLAMVCTICILIYEVTVVPHQLNDSIDWKKIDQQVRTNQTLTNSLSCDDIKEYREQAKLLVFTPHPEIVKDFNDLGIKRGCWHE